MKRANILITCSLLISVCLIFPRMRRCLGKPKAYENVYSVVYLYMNSAGTSYKEQKKLVSVFSRIARDNRYKQSDLRFKAVHVTDTQNQEYRKKYELTQPHTVLILRGEEAQEYARMTGAFSETTLSNFIEDWIGDYLTTLMAAQTEAKRAAKAVAYASYPVYPWGYPYYGWGYPFSAGAGFGVWF